MAPMANWPHSFFSAECLHWNAEASAQVTTMATVHMLNAKL